MAHIKNAAGYLDWEEGFLMLTHKLREEKRYKDHLLFTIMCYGALRIGDALNLKLSDIKSNKIIVEREEKTGKYKMIPMRKEIREAVKLYTSKYGDREQLFLNERGTKIMSSQYVNRILKKYVVSFKLKHKGKVSSHMFRKTFGRRCLEKGEHDPKVMIKLKEYLNHSNVETTYIYLGIQQEEVNKMVLSV